jgi:DNA adenine methylase
MAGGAALFFRNRPEPATLGDINAELMNFYAVLKVDFDRLRRALRPLRASHELYYQFRSRSPRTTLERAVRFAYLNRLAWNGLYRVNQHGHFNVPIGDRLPAKLWDFDELREASKALSGASLLTGDFSHALRYARTGDFVFIDPPYPRGAADTVGFNRYARCFFTADDHKRLATAVTRLSARRVLVMLLLADRRQLRRLYPTEMTCYASTSKALMSCNGVNRRPVRELILVNY